jgi:hypothetical protein
MTKLRKWQALLQAKWEWDPGESVQEYYVQCNNVKLGQVENELMMMKPMIC